MTKEATTKTTPHKKWLDEFTLELRLQDFPGTAVGDALATVEEFLADSGQSPVEAFGTPREYAAELAVERTAPVRVGMRSSVAVGAISIVVFQVFCAALTPGANGGQFLVGSGQLLGFAVLAALVLTLPFYLAFLLRHFWALIAFPIVGGMAGVLSAILTPSDATDALLVFPPGPVLLVSAGLLVAISGVGTVLALHTDDDSIKKPLDPVQLPPSLKARCFLILTQWLFPILAAALFGLTSLVAAVAS